MIVVWAFAAMSASAQMRIIPREKVEAVSNPRLSAESASLVFETMHIVAEPMTEDYTPMTFIYRFDKICERNERGGNSSLAKST